MLLLSLFFPAAAQTVLPVMKSAPRTFQVVWRGDAPGTPVPTDIACTASFEDATAAHRQESIYNARLGVSSLVPSLLIEAGEKLVYTPTALGALTLTCTSATLGTFDFVEVPTATLAGTLIDNIAFAPQSGAGVGNRSTVPPILTDTLSLLAEIAYEKAKSQSYSALSAVVEQVVCDDLAIPEPGLLVAVHDSNGAVRFQFRLPDGPVLPNTCGAVKEIDNFVVLANSGVTVGTALRSDVLGFVNTVAWSVVEASIPSDWIRDRLREVSLELTGVLADNLVDRTAPDEADGQQLVVALARNVHWGDVASTAPVGDQIAALSTSTVFAVLGTCLGRTTPCNPSDVATLVAAPWSTFGGLSGKELNFLTYAVGAQQTDIEQVYKQLRPYVNAVVLDGLQLFTAKAGTSSKQKTLSAFKFTFDLADLGFRATTVVDELATSDRIPNICPTGSSCTLSPAARDGLSKAQEVTEGLRGVVMGAAEDDPAKAVSAGMTLISKILGWGAGGNDVPFATDVAPFVACMEDAACAKAFTDVHAVASNAPKTDKAAALVLLHGAGCGNGKPLPDGLCSALNSTDAITQAATFEEVRRARPSAAMLALAEGLATARANEKAAAKLTDLAKKQAKLAAALADITAAAQRASTLDACTVSGTPSVNCPSLTSIKSAGDLASARAPAEAVMSGLGAEVLGKSSPANVEALVQGVADLADKCGKKDRWAKLTHSDAAEKLLQAVTRITPVAQVLLSNAQSLELATLDPESATAQREARKKNIEALIDATTQRKGRSGQVIVSLGANVGLIPGYVGLRSPSDPATKKLESCLSSFIGAPNCEVPTGAVDENGDLLKETASEVAYIPLTLPMGIAVDYMARPCPAAANGTCNPDRRWTVGFHAQISPVDLGLFLPKDADKPLEDLTWNDFLMIGTSAGLAFGTPQNMFVVGGDLRYAPYARDTTQIMATVSYYVPFFDFN